MLIKDKVTDFFAKTTQYSALFTPSAVRYFHKFMFDVFGIFIVVGYGKIWKFGEVCCNFGDDKPFIMTSRLKIYVLIVIVGVLFSACGSHRAVSEGNKQEYSTAGIDSRHKKSDSRVGNQPSKNSVPMPDDASHPVFALLQEASGWLGTKYEYGGHSRGGTDCSGMVMEVFKSSAGIALPRNSREQMEACLSIDRKHLKPGDLVFFANNLRTGRIGHVGLYVGEGKIIHATSSRGVIISSLDEDYWHNHYAASGRVEAFEKKVRKHESSGQRYVKQKKAKQVAETNSAKPQAVKQKTGPVEEPVTPGQTAVATEPDWFD